MDHLAAINCPWFTLFDNSSLPDVWFRMGGKLNKSVWQNRNEVITVSWQAAETVCSKTKQEHHVQFRKKGFSTMGGDTDKGIFPQKAKSSLTAFALSRAIPYIYCHEYLSLLPWHNGQTFPISRWISSFKFQRTAHISFCDLIRQMMTCSPPSIQQSTLITVRLLHNA